MRPSRGAGAPVGWAGILPPETKQSGGIRDDQQISVGERTVRCVDIKLQLGIHTPFNPTTIALDNIIIL